MYKITLLFRTIRYLKPSQIYFRLYFLLRHKFGYSKFELKNFKSDKKQQLDFYPFLKSKNKINRTNIFLNQELVTTKHSDFYSINFFGKLWAYNSVYFESCSYEMIQHFIKNTPMDSFAYEPYPTSLRLINWIKFLSLESIDDARIDDNIYSQYLHIQKNQEFHLMGNHLLENLIALVFGAFYLNIKSDLSIITKNLISQLDEQYLDDGAHFERSTMYHNILLLRLLDLYNLIISNDTKLLNHSQTLKAKLNSKINHALGWSKLLSIKGENTVHFGDSTNKIAPQYNELAKYAKTLGLYPSNIVLSESGFNRIDKKNYTLISNVGEIKSNYIPGHSHADTFTFHLIGKNSPLIVNPGVSTYEVGPIRTNERSTTSHNSVSINGQNNTEVWSSFRVGRRPNVKVLVNTSDKLMAEHDGYRDRFGVVCTRTWEMHENSLIIIDSISQPVKSRFDLHFHPSITISKIKRSITSSSEYFLYEYLYPVGFNERIPALKITMEFEEYSKLIINTVELDKKL